MADERTVVLRILDLYDRGEPSRRIVTQLALENVAWSDGNAVRRAQIESLIRQYERAAERLAHQHEDDEHENWKDEEDEGYGIGSDRLPGDDEESLVEADGDDDDDDEDEEEEDEEDDEDEDEEYDGDE